jgi:Holliday junction resolvase-like predicted endonuclease/Sec-independent protein translocase protein TatA
MTDEALKALVADLVVSTRELRESQKQTDEQMKQTSRELRMSKKEVDEQMKQTDEQMKKTDEKLKKLGVLTGNISNSQGEVAEEYFINALKANPQIGKQRFDIIDTNTKRHIGSIQDEFDIILINGDSVAIVEVKYKLHPKDIERLEQKKESFRKLFPAYSGYKLYMGLASFKVPQEIYKRIEEKGYFLLQRNGDVIESYTDHLVAA